MKVIIFGKGKVGMATDLTLKTHADFHDPMKGHVITDFTKYDIAIICVSSLVNGPHDHDAIAQCLSLLNSSDFKGTVAIRCTIHPKYPDMWEIQYPNLNIIHFPEFMKQSDDVYLDTPWVLVLGGKQSLTQPFGKWLIDCGYGNNDQLLYCSMTESALIKLHQNAGLALKVTYANMMYRACKHYGVDYEIVRKGATADVRVGTAHTQVPGEHGFGFSGHCLPKDLKCLNASYTQHGFWNLILEVNDQLRTYNDYE